MLKIRALNRESSSDEDVPVIRREAQEEIALELYNNALRLQSLEKLTEAEEILLSLLNENVPQLENNGGLPSSMSTLKYSCCVNLGNIYLKKENVDSALDYYLNASELDNTDVTLWNKIGRLAIKQNRFRQAAYAFAKGLECSESHWPCLDQLISLLYAMKDTIGCLVYIGKALCLDANYTKGLVLRRQIYRDNPYTLPYYQEYNPDHIWEPPLDVSIDEEDEKLILAKEQILCDKISEVEKALGPKPLPTIPLPKALDDYTWVALGKVVIELHQYITDNGMSHFTMVDIERCMSQKVDVEMEEKVEEEPEKIEEVVEKNEEVEEKKEESETVVERRPSQNSETNNEDKENTPIQTDNDEEQPMEQDGDDPDENADNKTDKNRSLNRASKRKRDLLSDLQIWGWHSKRKSAKKGKSDKDFTVEDALNRIIPKHLLRSKIAEEKYNPCEDSMNTIDIYNMYVEKQPSILSPIHSPKSVNCEQYFGTDRERDDVQNLWKQPREYCDSVVLIRDFVISLSKLWNIGWPKELIQMYIDAYCMYREHFDHPQPFCGEATFAEMRDDAMATLLYGELLNFSVSKCEKSIHVTSLGFLQVISGWSEDWGVEFPAIFLRVFWLRAHIFRKDGDNDLAIRALEIIQETISEEEKKRDEKYMLNLPNCVKCSVINSEVVMKIFKHLDMITSLNCIEELYNHEKYREVAEILKLTFTSSNHPTSGKMGRPAQLAMLMHSLWYTDFVECFVWTEECLFEATAHFLKPVRDADKWEKVVEKCLAIFQEIIKKETVGVVDALSEEKRARLVETLSKIVCKQLNTDGTVKIPLGCVTPWILLHYILVREEHRQQASKKISHIKTDKEENSENPENQNEELPPSISILFSAHEFLGPKSWCLTNSGELLHFILDTILDRLDTPIFEPLREKIDIHIEQALFCLYQHPSKKNKVSRHLADHNVDPLPLSWERAFQLYDFYGPDCLPEFNSYKNASISSDLEQLLQRIIALVPSSMDPQPRMPKLTEFINGKGTELPEPLNFSPKVRAIYYLIGDYYFKQREFNRCIKYFMMDLCINPNRLDSWACIGLSYLSQLENKLNYCKKLKSEMEFLDKAKRAQVSFRKALDIEKDHIMLWIEFGSFEYMVHSFCSRVMKSESDVLSMERFEYLENQKNSYLDSTGRSFEKAIQLYQPDEIEADERWLQYYILGKVAEKKQQEPQEYLKHYVTASKLLHENNALYPDKINYHNPQHLSVEALELHYRINASILKYLELHEGKEIPNSVGNVFKEHLEKSYFPKKTLTKPPPNATKECKPPDGATKPKNEETSSEVKKCLDELVAKVEAKLKSEESVPKSTDVIMISDSDDEQPKTETLDLSKKENANSTTQDVQELLDKMMEETMKKTEEQEPDSDTSLTSKNVVEVKPEEGKEEEKNEKLKSGSETETDIRTSVDESSSSPTSSSSSSSSSDSDSDDDSSSSSSSSSSVTVNGNMSSGDIAGLIDRCVTGLEQCIIRLPQNYKALYRLAHLYYNYKGKKDLAKSKQLLLGEYTCKGGVVITGLFSDRKNHNFFHGIWRIPSSEIDRPGSLSAHMSRCITLLLQVLRATNDFKLLLDLSMQFRKAPDPDKIYIKDSERLQFADQAMAMCIQCLRSQIQNVPNMTDTATQRLLQDIFRIYQRVQKHEASKEATFGAMLTEVYKKMKKVKIPENANVLDLATKFCQQNRLAEKQKRQIANQAALLRGPGIATPPVLPAPSTVAPASQPPLKRPGMGRPRGRPPLPKVPGQARAPRGRSPNVSAPYSWQKTIMEQNATYNYLKQYQEELIKQYSQSLSLSQLTQLSQYFTQTQLASSLQSQFNSQFQNPLLNAANLLKQMNANQFMASQIETSKSSYKKKTDATSLSLESLKAFAGLEQTKAYKKNVPQTVTSSAQSATITKVKAPPSTVYNMSSPQQTPINLNKPKSYTKSETITHSVTSMSQTATTKAKSVYTHAFKSTYTPASYPTADLSKIKASVAATKTTASSQIFKEPIISKAHSSLHHKNLDKAANILMKDRPNISITPVLQPPMPLITTAAFMPPTQSSPTKTLQEKLADKQKQHSTKQLGRNIEAEIISAPLGAKKSLNIPSIPASLTVSKASSYKFPMDSGISISQIPVTKPYKSMEAINLHKKPTKPLDVNLLPPNLPLSLSVTKKPERKPPDDDVIVIE